MTDDACLQASAKMPLSAQEKLDALRREIDRGLEDLNTGHALDGPTAFAELKKRFPASPYPLSCTAGEGGAHEVGG